MSSNNKPVKIDLPVIHFEKVGVLNHWLEKNHMDSSGIWLRIFKKNSGGLSINYDQALDEALCFGWIDGQVKSYDDSHTYRNLLHGEPELCGHKEIPLVSSCLFSQHIYQFTKIKILQYTVNEIG